MKSTGTSTEGESGPIGPRIISCLVTGSSGGIGRAIALALARGAACVTLNHRSQSGAARSRAVADEVVAAGARAQVVCADVMDPVQLEALLAASVDFGGGLDVVVANAVGETLFKPMVDLSLEEWERVTVGPQRAVFNLLRLAARAVRDDGRIIAISSSMTADPYAGTAAYMGVKMATEGYVRVLAREIGGRGVTVNAVAPGLTDTPGMRAMVPGDRIDATVARTPLGRLGRPEDVADVVAMLASPDARWLTGQVIRAGGGVV